MMPFGHLIEGADDVPMGRPHKLAAFSIQNMIIHFDWLHFLIHGCYALFSHLLIQGECRPAGV